MEDYLSEAEQWERAKAWVRTYGVWILGGVALALIGIFGWNWYQDRQEAFGVAASAKYEQMTQALSRNEIARAKAISAELEKDFKGSPYVDQAHLFRGEFDGGDGSGGTRHGLFCEGRLQHDRGQESSSGTTGGHAHGSCSGYRSHAG